ncbi:hypothetical protein VPHF99_0308 [Vibrio phage F99]
MSIPSRTIKFVGVEIIADECKQVGVKWPPNVGL